MISFKSVAVIVSVTVVRVSALEAPPVSWYDTPAGAASCSSRYVGRRVDASTVSEKVKRMVPAFKLREKLAKAGAVLSAVNEVARRPLPSVIAKTPFVLVSAMAFAATRMKVLAVPVAMLRPLLRMFMSDVVNDTETIVPTELVTVELAESARLRVGVPAWLCRVSWVTISVLESTVSSNVNSSDPVFMFREKVTRLGDSESAV